MCAKSQVPLRDRLMRSRAVSLALGRREFHCRPLDVPRGRPSKVAQVFLELFRRPFPDCDGKWLSDLKIYAVQYLEAIGRRSGWFEVTERAEVLGTRTTIRVRDFDALFFSRLLFEPAYDCPIWACDGAGELCVRRFVPMIGPAPRQRMHARRIQDASNFSEVAYV